MNFSKKKALFALAATSLLSTQIQAASVSGSMDLKVTMPEILVLYHFDEVQIDLSSATTSTAANDSDDHEISETFAGTISGTMGTPITQALSITGTDTNPAATGTVEVTLTDAWAVRSISSADVTVTGSIQTNDLTHADGSTIGVAAMELTSGANTGTSVDLAPQWALQTGDISFELDLSAASHAGLYETAGTDATDTFLLTLTGN